MTERRGLGCEGRGWELTAFVMGELGAVERAELVAHLQHCPFCLGEVASLTDTLERVSSVVPAMAPSEGFVGRVVASLPDGAVSGPVPTAVGPTAVGPTAVGPTAVDHTVSDHAVSDRAVRRHTFLGRTVVGPRAPWHASPGPVARGRRGRAGRVVAAGVAAGVLVVAGLLLHGSAASTRPRPLPAAVAEMRTITGSGVGQAVLFPGDPALVSVDLDVPPGTAWAPSGPYRVLVVRRDGQQVDLGTVTVVDGEGGIQARLPVAAADITTVRVEGPDGRSLCAGLVPGPP